MALEHNLGSTTSVLWGPFLLSDEGPAAGLAPERQKIAVRATLENDFNSENVGSVFIGGTTFNLTRPGLQFEMMEAWQAKTKYPMVIAVRGAAGNLFQLVDNVGLAANPYTDTPDEIETRDLDFTAGDSAEMSLGWLFDHTIADPAGVTAPTDGSGVNLGAVLATESITIYLASPHAPAADSVGAVFAFESDSTNSFSGAETVEHTFTTIDDVANGASFQLVTVAGPITNTWFRIVLNTITSGTSFFKAGAVIHTT